MVVTLAAAASRRGPAQGLPRREARRGEARSPPPPLSRCNARPRPLPRRAVLWEWSTSACGRASRRPAISRPLPLPASSPRVSPWGGPSPELGAAGRRQKMEVRELGLGGRAGSSADSLAEEEEEDEDEEGPGSGRSSRTSSLVSGLLTELYSAAEAAAPSGSARSPGERELQQRPSQVKYLRLKGTARPALLLCPASALPCPLPWAAASGAALPRYLRAAWAGSCPCPLAFFLCACNRVQSKGSSTLSPASSLSVRTYTHRCVRVYILGYLLRQLLCLAISPRNFLCTVSRYLRQTKAVCAVPSLLLFRCCRSKNGVT